METAYKGWLDRLRQIEGQIPKGGRPWFGEIVDGVEINLLRARQAHRLYDAVATFREAQLAQDTDPRAKALPIFKEAEQALQDAEQVIRRREKHYRYPPEQMFGGGLTSETGKANGTTYPFRVHTKTHLLTYWTNRNDQARDLLEGRGGGVTDLVLKPTVAAPGKALTLRWPRAGNMAADVTLGTKALTGLERVLDLGQEEGYWAVSGKITVDGTAIPVTGGVVRTTNLATSPQSSFTLVQPDSPLAQSVLGPLFPAVIWALLAGTSLDDPPAVVFAPDLDGAGNPSFRHLFHLPLAWSAGGRFVTAPASVPLPIPNPGTGAQALTIGVEGFVLKGIITPSGLGSPLRIEGALSLADLVKVLIDLAGFDEKGAHAVLGTVLGYDPANPPESTPFVAEIEVQPKL
jgi:hypothetical protein